MKKLCILLFSLILLFQAGADDIRESRFHSLLFPSQSNGSTDELVKKINGILPYQLTPGDTFNIYLIMKNPGMEMNTELSYFLILSDKYELEIPYMGAVKLKGMQYFAARDMIVKELKKLLPTLYFINFQLTSPALFEVFIYGRVIAPGFIDTTSLNRVSDVISQAKGLSPDGSLRKIQLIRGDKTQTLDFFHYLNRGDTSLDPFLQPGDRIYIPSAEVLCNITGLVVYPGTYELVAGETLQQLLDMAGGLSAEGSESGIRLTRVSRETGIDSRYVNAEDAGTVEIQNGDIIHVKSKLENKEVILVEGALFNGPYNGKSPRAVPTSPVLMSTAFIPGITLLQVLENFGGPTPYADAEKSFIIKKTGEKIPVNVKELWESKTGSLDFTLAPGDHIFIPIRPLEVTVGGNVNRPGSFPFTTETKIGDYILLAGGINPDSGSADNLFIIDTTGKQTEVTVDTAAAPGMLVYAGRNSWSRTEFGINRVHTILGISSAVITLVSGIIGLVNTIMNLQG